MVTAFLRFPRFWYWESIFFFPRFFGRIITYWDDRLAFSLNFVMFFVPLFHDDSLVGRILSVLFRLVRVFFGLVVLFIISAAAFFGLGLWVLFPFIGFFIFGWAGVVVTVGIMLLWSFITLYDTPRFYINGDCSHDCVRLVARPSVLNVVGRGDVSVYDGFIRLINQRVVKRLLTTLNIPGEKLLDELKVQRTALGSFSSDELLNSALNEAHALASPDIDALHLFIAFLEKSEGLTKLLTVFDIHPDDVRGAVRWLEKRLLEERPSYMWNFYYTLSLYGGVNRAWTSRPTPTLDLYSKDLTKLAQKKRIIRTVGREHIVEDIFRVLARSGRDNVMLLGPTGSGKSTLVGGLAYQIIAGNAPSQLRYRRVISLDIAKLLSGTKTEGEIGERMEAIIDEIMGAGNIFLFIDEIHELLKGEKGNAIILNALEPHLNSDEFTVIAATTFEDYKVSIEPRRSFASLFQNITVSEASKEETLVILFDTAPEFERKHSVTISYKAISAAVGLSSRYMHDSVLPEKAVSLLDEACGMVSARKSGNRSLVTEEDVASVVVLKTHIPVASIKEEESQKLLHLEERLHERVIGQDEAVKAVADALRRARVGLKSEHRPIASLLFLGPTGVGKTELSKALAEVYFGSEDAIIRLDMSEYQTKESVNKLIGAPPGSSDSASGGQLTEAVRRKPFTLVLLDEIEKAYPDIFNLFLQVLEDGRLTDSLGRTVDFSNVIVIATSNAAASTVQDLIRQGAAPEIMKQKVFEELRATFRPEFLNRFDGMIVFRPLSMTDVEAITRLLVGRVQRELSSKDISLEISDELIKEFAKRGFEPTLGARPLRRLIQDTLESRIAKEMLTGSLKKGSVAHFGLEIFTSSS